MSLWSILSRRIYLDHAAATPLRMRVFLAMAFVLLKNVGNASAVHTEGRSARQIVTKARIKIATTFGVKPTNILFTGSGTESNNLSILGYLEQLHKSGLKYEEMEVITTRIEHPSITALIPELKRRGVVVKFVEVDQFGLITRGSLINVLSKQTVLLTFAYANSEVGTVQPVHALVRIVREHQKVAGTFVQIHLDAAQAPLWLPCSLSQLGVDSIALDTGKCGGPKGVGVIILRDIASLSPIIYGGGQESNLRPGTENVPAIAGAAVALAIAAAKHQERAKIVASINKFAQAYLKEKLSQAVINGPRQEDRLPNNLNFSLPGFDTEYAVIWLDKQGVAASTKSACAGAGGGMSQVVLALCNDQSRAKSTIRFSFGEDTTRREVKKAIDVLTKYCAKMVTIDQVGD